MLLSSLMIRTASSLKKKDIIAKKLEPKRVLANGSKRVRVNMGLPCSVLTVVFIVV